MGTHKERRLRRLAAAGLISILLTSGCAGPAIGTGSEPSTQQAERIEVEEAWRSMQKTAAEELNRYLWPRESVQKTILGEEIEFILYHGNGWTIHVPASWEEHHTGLAGEWESPSHCASFSVSQQFGGINNPKWYRAQQGSWRHETDYAPPLTIIMTTMEAIPLPPAVVIIFTFSPRMARSEAMNLPFRPW